MTAEGIDFAIGRRPLPILIDLVGRDQHDGSYRVTGACGLQHVRRTGDVAGQRAERIAVTLPDNRLGGEVKDHFRSRAGECGF